MSSSPAAAKRLGNAVEEIGENITGMQDDAGKDQKETELYSVIVQSVKLWWLHGERCVAQNRGHRIESNSVHEEENCSGCLHDQCQFQRVALEPQFVA